MVDIYGVTIVDILGKLPIDSSEISATSEPVSTTDITRWVNQGAAEVATTIVNAGVSSADEVTRQQCATATIAYAVKEALGTMGMLGTQAYRDASDGWAKSIGSMRANNLNEPSSSKAESNFSGRPAQWRGRNFRGF